MRKGISAVLLLAMILAGCGTKQAQPSPTQSQPAVQPSAAAPASAQPQAAAPAEKRTISFMAAAQGGAWYPLAVALQKVLKENVPEIAEVTIKPGGGTSNAKAIGAMTDDIGFTTALSSVDATLGNPPYDKKYDGVRHVATLFPHIVQVVVLKDSPYQSVADLKGKKVNVGQRGLTSETVAKLLMETYGLSPNDFQLQFLGFQDAAEQMKDGHIDAIMMTSPAPFAPFLDLARAREIRVLQVPPDKLEALRKANSGFLKTQLPANTYRGQAQAVDTLQTPLHLVASAKLSDDLVYKITKAVVEHLGALQDVSQDVKQNVTVQTLAADVGTPYHPGAIKYYKEKGLAK